MDDIVKQALAKWPNVPDCYGWLGLDARGNWFMRDDRVQSLGPFAGGSAQSKGSQLLHEKLIEFIHRNYEPDAQGQWYFQNGPQRVYVELEITPLIWRVNDDFSIQDHTGHPGHVQCCLLDEQGRVYLVADTGFGLVHTMDMSRVADAVEQGLWVPQEVMSADLPQRFSYIASPQLLQKK
ncbi:MAG: DUF2946 family protein [Pseudomonadota bacterium]